MLESFKFWVDKLMGVHLTPLDVWRLICQSMFNIYTLEWLRLTKFLYKPIFLLISLEFAIKFSSFLKPFLPVFLKIFSRSKNPGRKNPEFCDKAYSRFALSGWCFLKQISTWFLIPRFIRRRECFLNYSVAKF